MLRESGDWECVVESLYGYQLVMRGLTRNDDGRSLHADKFARPRQRHLECVVISFSP